MECLEQGDAIIRPSSKVGCWFANVLVYQNFVYILTFIQGSDHLTLTWKVGEGVVQHVDIREEGKSNPSCLGKSLHIGSEVWFLNIFKYNIIASIYHVGSILSLTVIRRSWWNYCEIYPTNGIICQRYNGIQIFFETSSHKHGQQGFHWEKH